MKTAASLVVLALVAGCPGDDGNPGTLWFAPDNAETALKFQADEPSPY